MQTTGAVTRNRRRDNPDTVSRAAPLQTSVRTSDAPTPSRILR